MSYLSLFILLQTITLVLISLHDWVDIRPFTNIPDLEKYHSVQFRLFSSFMNGLLVLIPLFLTIYFQASMPRWAGLVVAFLYGLLTLGTICAWWIPYIFGSSEKHKQGFIEFKNTHHFLPARNDNVIPNTFHVIMHLFIWSCFGLSVYFLFS